MALVPAIYQSTSQDAFLFLLTITTPTDTIRVVNDWQNLTSRGDTYLSFPFSLSLPMDTGDTQNEIRLVIDNVDQTMVEAIRGLPEPPQVKVEMVISSTPDTVEKTIDFLRLTSVEYDALSITGKLRPDNILARKFPQSTYDSLQFPNLYWA